MPSLAESEFKMKVSLNELKQGIHSNWIKFQFSDSESLTAAQISQLKEMLLEMTIKVVPPSE